MSARTRTPRTGRRPGHRDTRAEVLAAARRCFADSGYDRTTMRGVAAAAGIDAALIHRQFGTKRELFLASIGLPEDLTQVLAKTVAGGPEGMGTRVVLAFLELWDRAEAAFRGIVRLAAEDADAAALLRSYVTTTLAGALAQSTGLPDSRERAGMIGTHLLGLGVARYVLKLEPIASAPPEKVAAEMGCMVQRLLADRISETAQKR